MAKKSRKRANRPPGQEAPPRLKAPTTTYTDTDGVELELRGSLTVKARADYAVTLGGGFNQEDAWQRATEMLFERLTVSWTIAGLRLEKQKDLLRRYRLASATERRFVRDSLRTHLAENFPDMEAP